MAARSRVAVFLIFAALLTGAARAQQLARLHVQSITLSASTPQPQVDTPFDVTLTIRVRENPAGPLDNVVLPTFAGADELGDERVFSHGPGGSVYRETLRLVAHSTGPLVIGSAYLDAIDARDGKAKRFISNELHLNVGGAPFDVWRPLRALALGFLEIVLLLTALFVVVTIFRRKRREPVPAPAPAQAATPVYVAPPVDRLDAEFERLRARRDRPAVLRVREALWASVGAQQGETLGDALRRTAARDEPTRRMLVAAERAAFVEDERLPQAVEDLLEEREGRIA